MTMKVIFRLGRGRTEMIELDDQTTMLDVYGCILNSFKDVLPSKFHIEFYSFEARRVLTLDQDLIDSENNPFRFKSTNGEITNAVDCEQFLIIDDSAEEDHIDSKSTNLIDDTVSNDLKDALINISPTDGLDEALLASLFSPNPSTEVISHNNIAVDDTDVDEDITDDNSENLVDSQNSNASSADFLLATETTDVIELSPDRITFSSDVHPEQKHQHLTDKFNIDHESNENGGISLIQGTNTKKIQVLPHLLIPRFFCLMRQFILFIYAVYEEVENDGTRIWYKHPHKGFLLPGQLKPNAEFFNPIELLLNASQWKENGDYTLEMYMLTKWDKTSKYKQEIHRLSKIKTDQIHKAEHVKSSDRKPIKPTRLLCVPKVDNRLCWSSFGLSDFIRPPSKNKQPVPLIPNTMPIPNINLNLITAVRIVPPPFKRQRI